VNGAGDDSLTVSEQDMYDRERRAFLNLAKTPQTIARIASLLDTGEAMGLKNRRQIMRPCHRCRF